MQSVKSASVAAVVLAAWLCACSKDSTTGVKEPDLIPASCPGLNLGPSPSRLSLTSSTPAMMQVLGIGNETARYTGEVSARGSIAYTTTWGSRSAVGNKVDVWDVSGSTPVLIDSAIVSGATTLGDVAVSDDGKLLVVATERAGGSIVIFDLTDPRHPKQVSRFNSADTDPGVHTAEIGRINGKLYGFLSIDPSGSSQARLVIVDLSTPTAPRQVFMKVVGDPFVHDTFVRDGLLFVALWDAGMEIWDLGGCGTGATPEGPRVLGGVATLNGDVHNIWWYYDPSGSKRFAFVGEEGPGSIGSNSRGDIHVVDISDLTHPKEVAFYHVEGAGTHNFSVDEAHGVLYAAYYNGGVRALDIRGDLGTCAANQQIVTASNLTRCDLRLMGRELATGLIELNRTIYIWGVQYLNGTVFASDMVSGLWKLKAAR